MIENIFVVNECVRCIPITPGLFCTDAEALAPQTTAFNIANDPPFGAVNVVSIQKRINLTSRTPTIDQV
jgi:hypothetical protein